MQRIGGRNNEQIRPVKIIRNYLKHAEGSVLIEMGDTKVICTASVDDKVPPLKRNRQGLDYQRVRNASQINRSTQAKGVCKRKNRRQDNGNTETDRKGAAIHRES